MEQRSLELPAPAGLPRGRLALRLGALLPALAVLAA